MNPDIETFLYAAEDHFLQPQELEGFQETVATLAQRLEVYEALRDQEIDIFQPIANQLEESFPNESQHLLERALTRWLSVLRYSAMAMLMNNPEYLQRRLLEWLTDIVQVHSMEDVENKLSQLLKARLAEMLSEEQIALIQPFLEQAESTLLKSSPRQGLVEANQ